MSAANTPSQRREPISRDADIAFDLVRASAAVAVMAELVEDGCPGAHIAARLRQLSHQIDAVAVRVVHRRLVRASGDTAS